MPTDSRRTRSRRRDGVRNPARHNLAVLNPGTRSPGLAPSLAALERESGLRFVLRTRNRPRPETIERRILAAHGLVVDVSPLFRTIDAGPKAGDIGRRYLVTLPGLSRRDIALSPFELGYRLADTPGLEVEAVEPDLPHSIYAGNVATEAARFGGIPLCEVDDDDTLDHGWHLNKTHVPDAWALPPQDGGRRHGAGIVVGHPDTGWVIHDELDRSAVITSRSWDFVDGDADASDPLTKPWLSIGLLGQPGHGLGTGSVIVSRQSGRLRGVAPGARLVPIRAVTRVWQIFSGDLARALEYAASKRCHVISMSLGGLPSEALERAVNYAVAQDVIVCAAAGNCVHVVVAPGLYPNAACVAASNNLDKPWVGSCRGPAVDIAAPGENVWVARRRKGESSRARIGQSQGTSPATATVAGVAALWLAFHGRDALLARYRGAVRLQHVFLHLVRQTARRVAGWDKANLGPGIVDAKALLEAPLPTAAAVAADLTDDPFRMLKTEEVAARMVGEPDPMRVRASLAHTLDFGVSPDRASVAARARFETGLSRFGPELLHILAEDRAAYLQFRAALDAGAVAARSPATAGAGASFFVGDEVARVASASLRARLSRREGTSS